MINEEELKILQEEYLKNKNNVTLNRIVNKVPLTDLITDSSTKFDNNFDIEIDTHGITNQEKSGRCWSFAILNMLREIVIRKCNLDNFELSGSYIGYYEKLERFNKKMDNLIQYKLNGKKIYDPYVSHLLKEGITDEGWFIQFAQLINKYGIVPKENYQETYQSSHTYEINQILSRLLRKFYLEIENEKDLNNINIIRQKYLKYAYKIITSLYGIPPQVFDFEYKDKLGKYHIDKNLTPQSFFNKYINIDLLKDYIEVGSYKDKLYKYHNIYEFEDTSQISGENDFRMLNVSPDELKKLIFNQILDGELVYFYSSTTQMRVDGVWIDIMDRYSDIFDIDLRLDKNDIIKTNARTGEHCMVFVGVKTKDGLPIKWKIENSWGGQFGNNGYYIADDDWVNKYVYMAVINKKYLSQQQENCLNKPLIKIKKWNAKLD